MLRRDEPNGLGSTMVDAKTTTSANGQQPATFEQGTPLRAVHEQYLRELTDQPAEARDEAHRPGAATGQRVAADEPELIPYWDAGDGSEHAPRALVGVLDSVETEYAALRRGAGLFDRASHAVVEVRGGERNDFLNRLLTQKLVDMQPGEARASFWCNRKGRLIADVLVVETGELILLDVDVHQIDELLRTLDEYLFAEDVELHEARGERYRIAAHGPAALEVVAKASGRDELALDHGRAATVTIAGCDVVVARHDAIGEIGLELIAPLAKVETIWNALREAGGSLSKPVRPVGWYAYNIARIEAGTPMINVDFDTTSLPGETGVLDRRVSFNKGCFIGQEVVARMKNLGKPKQMLVGLKVAGDALPAAGSEVFAKSDEGGRIGDPIGVVTSSTLSPMLGAQPIALAMVKSKHLEGADTVVVAGEGDLAEATVGPLRFWPPAQSSDDAAAKDAGS